MFCEGNINEERPLGIDVRATSWRIYSKSLIVELKEKLAVRRAKTLALLSENSELTAFTEIDTLSDGLDDSSTNTTNAHDLPDIQDIVSRQVLRERNSPSRTGSIAGSDYTNDDELENESENTRETSEPRDSRLRRECCSSSITSVSQDSITSEDSISECPELAEVALGDDCKITFSQSVDIRFSKSQKGVNNQTTRETTNTDRRHVEQNLQVDSRDNSRPLLYFEGNVTKQILHLEPAVGTTKQPMKAISDTCLQKILTTSLDAPRGSCSDAGSLMPSSVTRLTTISEWRREGESLNNKHDKAVHKVSEHTCQSDVRLCSNKESHESYHQDDLAGSVPVLDVLADNSVDDVLGECLSSDVDHSFEEQSCEEEMYDAADNYEEADDEEEVDDDGEGDDEEEQVGNMRPLVNIIHSDITNACQDEKGNEQMSEFLEKAELETSRDRRLGRSVHIISSVSSQSNCRTKDQLMNIAPLLQPHEEKYVSSPGLYQILEEMIHIFESNLDFYNAIDKDLIGDFNNYFASLTEFISANRNKSGNSGYNPAGKIPGTAGVGAKNKTSGLSDNASDDSLDPSLLVCLEKARLASALQVKVGHMTNRADNFAAVKAYEKSVSDFEQSMRGYLRAHAEGSAACEALDSLPSAKSEETPEGRNQESAHPSEHSILRRSNTFVVEEPCTAKPPVKPRRRKSFVNLKEHSNQGKIFNETENEIDEVTFVIDSESNKNPHSSPTFLVEDSSAQFDLANLSITCQAEANSPSGKTSASQQCSNAKRRQSVKGIGYFQIDRDFDSDTSESLSETKENISQLYTPKVLAKLLGNDSPDEDRKVESDSEKENKKSNKDIGDVKSPSASEGCLQSLKKFRNVNVIDKLLGNEDNSVNQTVPRSPIKAFSSESNVDDKRREKSECKEDFNKDYEGQKFPTGCGKPVNDVYQERHGHLHGKIIADGKDKQSSDKDNGKIILQDSESLFRETSKHCDKTYEDLKDSSARDGLPLPSSSSPSKEICSPKEQQMLHSFRENASCLDQIKVFKCDTSPLAKPKINEKANTSTLSKEETSTTWLKYAGSSSKCSPSSRTYLKSQTKWRPPMKAKDNTSEDKVAKLDWSSSDEDAADDVQHDKSPSDILRHRQKADVNNKLEELNQYSRRSKKFKSPLRKRTDADTHRWIENHECTFKLNDITEVADLAVDSYCARQQRIEKNDSSCKMKELISLVKETGTEVKKLAGSDVQEDSSSQVLMSVSQLLHARDEDEIETLTGQGVSYTVNEGNINKTDNKKTANKGSSNMMMTEPENSLSSAHVNKTFEGKILESFPQENCAKTWSYTSTTSDEYILPVFRYLTESKSENDMKKNDYDKAAEFLINSGSPREVTNSEGKNPHREALLNQSDTHMDDRTAATTLHSSELRNKQSKAKVHFDNGSSRTLVDQSGSSENDHRDAPMSYFNVTEENARVDSQSSSQRSEAAVEQLAREMSATEPKVMKPPYVTYFYSLKEGDVPDVVTCEGSDLNSDDDETAFAGSKVPADNKPEDNNQRNIHNSLEASNLPDSDRFACVARGQETEAEINGKDNVETNPEVSAGDELPCSRPYNNKLSDVNDHQVCHMTIKEHGSAATPSAELPLFRSEGGALSSKSEAECCMFQCANLLSKLQSISELQDKVEQLQKMFQMHDFGNRNICRGSQRAVAEHQVSLSKKMENPHFQRRVAGQPIVEQIGRPLCYCCCMLSSNNDPDKRLKSCNPAEACSHQSCPCRHATILCSDGRYRVPLDHSSFVPVASQTQQNLIDTGCLVSDHNKKVEVWTQCVNDSLDHGNSQGVDLTEDRMTAIHHNIQEIKHCEERVSSAVTKLEERMKHFTEHTTTVLSNHSACLEQLQQLVSEGFKTLQTSFNKEEVISLSIKQQITAAELSFETKQQSLHAEHMEAIKRSEQAVQEAVLPLNEAISSQRKEIDEIRSSTEKIASTLEATKQEQGKRGMDYDTMKERIVELTSQRDAEKVFHKITRQSLRALERDHERLRQEYVCAACKRYQHGTGDVQKRMWYFLKNHDEVHQCNDNQSNRREALSTYGAWSPGQARPGGKSPKYVRRRKYGRHHSCRQVHNWDPDYPRTSPNCCHFEDGRSFPESAACKPDIIHANDSTGTLRLTNENTNTARKCQALSQAKGHGSRAKYPNKMAVQCLAGSSKVNIECFNKDCFRSELGHSYKVESLVSSYQAQHGTRAAYGDIDLLSTSTNTETSLTQKDTDCSCSSCLQAQSSLYNSNA